MGSDENAAVKAGVFVVLCVILLVVAIVVLGRSSQLFTRQYTLWAEFRNAQGLMPGADVRLAGVNAGSVRSVRIAVNSKGAKVVRVYMNIVKTYQPMITAASTASIRTLGPLGDKYVEISFETVAAEGTEPGELDPTTILEDGSRIKAEETADFYEIAQQAKETLVSAYRRH